MKILMVSHEYPPIGGGGANACRFLSREYIKNGHSVTLVTACFPGLKEREDEEGLEIFRLRSKRKRKDHCSFGEMADFILKALPFCLRLQRERQFDISMIYFGIPSGVVGYIMKKRCNLPYIIRFGGGDIPGFQERFRFVYGLLGPFVRLIWKNASALVANSSGLKDFALAFCDRYPVEVIPNGVDTGFFRERVPGPEGELRLLFVSRLLERKGLQYLLPHLEDIEKETGKRVSLTVVGDGPYRPELERITAETGNGARVRFMGQRDKEELPDFFSNADIFVFPSKREGMPNAVLEAMASALPVVMTPCEGSKELIDGNGVIAKGEFYLSVLEAVRSGRLEEMGRKSLERARDIFSWSAAADRYLKIMENI